MPHTTSPAFAASSPLPVLTGRTSNRRSRAAPSACASAPEAAAEAAPAAADEAPSACAGCGREGGPVRGCDGAGRVIGGLGAVLPWWPIKAYRPCGELSKAGGRYQRAGQSLDEIAFGRKDRGQ